MGCREALSLLVFVVLYELAGAGSGLVTIAHHSIWLLGWSLVQKESKERTAHCCHVLEERTYKMDFIKWKKNLVGGI